MKIDKEEVRRKKDDANEAKHRLMNLQDELYAMGAVTDAEQLGKIIVRLEVWQNR